MEAEELFKKLAPVIGPEKMEKLWLIYQTEPDCQRRRHIEGILHALATKYLSQSYQTDKILLPPPSSLPREGFHLGTIYYGDRPVSELYLSEDELLRHVAVLGATGTGKTNLGLLVVKQLLEKGIPFWVFDWKRNYRDILDCGWAQEQACAVFTVGRDVAPFSLDPFQPPPGTSQDIWDGKLLDVLSHSHFLGHGVRYLMSVALLEMEKRSFEGLLNSLNKTKAIGRKRQWLDSAIRAVADLSMSYIGKVFNNDENYPLEKLLQQNIIFELDALNNSAKTFFIEIILAWIHQYYLNQPMREQLKHVMLIEEAHHVLLKRNIEQETIMDVIFREVREFGQAILFLDQHPSLISKPALGNAGTTILLRLKHADDVKVGADAVLLDPKDRHYLGQLSVGWAIVKAPSMATPCTIKVPHVEVKKGKITDEELKRRMADYSKTPKNILPLKTLKTNILPIQDRDKQSLEEWNKLSPEELELLKDILSYPTSGVAERYKRLSFSGNKGNKVKNSLLKRSMIEESSVPLPRGALKLLEITEAGKKALAAAGTDVSRLNLSKKLGGPEHRYWVNKIEEELSANGHEVQKETYIGRKSPDLITQKDSQSIAIEVETGKSNPVRNIQKNLALGFGSVYVVATNQQTKNRIITDLL